MKNVAVAVALAVLGAPAVGDFVLAAQENEDPPEGWMVRFDREGGSMDDVFFVDMPPGFHITTGPAMIAYHPDSVATGNFRIESETYLFDPKGRREAFGFFVGGTDLAGDGQAYTYFLIRDGGQFLVKQRMGSETPTVQGWTSHDAIVAWSGEEDSTAKNVLALSVEGDLLSFSVNGQEVWSGAKGDLAVDGVFGLRVNHGLNVHITSITRGGS